MSKGKKVRKALAATSKGVEYAVTLGGSKAVKDARSLYDASFTDYQEKHSRLTRINSDTDIILKHIGESI